MIRPSFEKPAGTIRIDASSSWRTIALSGIPSVEQEVKVGCTGYERAYSGVSQMSIVPAENTQACRVGEREKAEIRGTAVS
ncbi:MAG TPA: hypothetical protein PKJ03_05810 [Methanoregulaceae archaeon]|nr:hypothetical protein [Methanoregulaceae archaeon]